MTEVNKISKTRRYKYGINAFILTISIIGIVFILNAVITKYSIQYDITKNKNFSLSSQTTKMLANLKKRVAIYIFSKDGNSKNELLNDILKQYTRESGYIKVVNIDLDKNPSLSNKFKVTELGTIVFECGDYNTQFNQTKLYGFDPGADWQGATSEFRGEQLITSNIMNVTNEKKKTVYFLIGHGERLVNNMEGSGFSKISDYLFKDNYDVKSINISKRSSIPAKDSVLIIPGPKYLIREKEVQVIEDYLEEGGNVFLMIDPRVVVSDGITKFLAKRGIDIENNIVIDTELSYFNDFFTPIPNYVYHPITKELIRTKIRVILPGARTITKQDKVPDDLDINKLLFTSEKSWAETDFISSEAILDEDDMKGPLTLALSVEKKIIEDSDTTQSEGNKVKEKTIGGRLVAIGDSDFATNRMVTSKGNIELFLNTVNWLAGDVDKISIRPIVLDFTKMEITNNQSKIILIICLVLIPLLVAGIGGVIWWKRSSL